MKNKKITGICMILLLLLSVLPVTAENTSEINEYSTKVASFIEEKCNSSCENVLILGEDAVVPHYRRNIGMYSGMWWWKELEKEDLLTDQLYTQTGSIYFADIDKLFGKKQDVMFIISSDLTDDLHGKVEELKTTIENKYPSSDVTTVDESTVACNSFSKLDDATLIIIGDEGNNNAINCMPFLPKETSYISIERNVWDNEHYAIVLNPTEDIYDNLLALINIVKDGPDPDWHFGNTVVACLWDGKFGGSVPTAKEITCNMIPLIELAPDIRDSWHCKKYLTPWFIFDEEKDNAVDVIICEVVHFATAYDLATWGAAIFTAGISGAGGEIIDGSIATLKVSLKTMLPAIAKAIGPKIVKEALETIMAAPKLLKGVTELIIKSPKLIPQMIEASLHILRHGPEIAENTFNIALVTFKNLKWDLETLKALPYYVKYAKKNIIPIKYTHLANAGDDILPKAMRLFDDGKFETVTEAVIADMKMANYKPKKIELTYGENALGATLNGVQELEAVPSTVAKDTFLLTNKDKSVREAYLQIYNANINNPTQYKAQVDALFDTLSDQQKALMDTKFYNSQIYNTNIHELAHEKLNGLRRFSSDNNLDIKTRYFRELLADTFPLAKVRDEYADIMKETIKSEKSHVFLLRLTENTQNLEAATVVKKGIQRNVDALNVDQLALDRALATKLGADADLIAEYDSLLKSVLTQRYGDQSRVNEIYTGIKTLTQKFIAKSDETIPIMAKESFSTADVNSFKTILDEISQEIRIAEGYLIG